MKEKARFRFEVDRLVKGQRQKQIIYPAGFMLHNGKEIPLRYIEWTNGRVDPNSSPNLLALAQRGMPIDIDWWNLTIDGEGMGQRNYAFQFIGVVVHDSTSRPDAVSNEPFLISCRDAAGEMDTYLLGFLWESRVILKESQSFIAEIYAPGLARSSAEHPKCDLIAHINAMIPLEARGDIMRKLARGYDLILALWKEVITRKAGRKSAFKLRRETVPCWSEQHNAALMAIKNELSRRKPKLLSKHDESGRKMIIKRALPDLPNDVKDALALSSTPSKIALQYTGWRCSGIPINTWKADRLRDILQESDRINGFQRKGNKK